MYDDEVTRVPRDEDELWEILKVQFSYIKDVLWNAPVETREDALNQKFQKSADGGVHRDILQAIKYRNMSEEYDNRDHFLEMGRSLLPYIDWAIDTRQFTAEFAQQWGKLMFCHGYVAAQYFDDSDDMIHDRAGAKTGAKRSRALQKKWLAHLMIPLVDGNNQRRADAEEIVLAHIKRIIADGKFPTGFGQEWFAAMITHGNLAATYDEKHLSVATMRKLAEQPADDIPDTTIRVP